MSNQIFSWALALALTVCGLGCLWRLARWFHACIGQDAAGMGAARRVRAAWSATVAMLASGRLPQVLRANAADILLQRRLFAVARLRWLAHTLIALGFILLLLMHALAPISMAPWIASYQPTLNPYLFLRNLFAVMILVGLAFLFGARTRQRASVAVTRTTLTVSFSGLLVLVIVTGLLLEAQKIASPQAFYRMAQLYAGTTDPQDLLPLRAYWQAEFGVAFQDLEHGTEHDLLERGRRVHAEGCASCHARPTSAFVSYPLARTFAPIASTLDRARGDVWLLYLHVFSCLLGLASLPFTRFRHVLADPISLLADNASRLGANTAAGRATRRALASDACVQCGLCDLRCSVAPLARFFANAHILPSYKLAATHVHARRRSSDRGGGAALALASYLCTDCGRCTEACPVGLDLADLWQAGRQDLAAAGMHANAVRAAAAASTATARLATSAPAYESLLQEFAPLAANRQSFSRCVQCQTCTNVCPVVEIGARTDCGPELTPQKIMNLLRLGMSDLALSSRMVRDCATCYRCQEYCPEGIRVTDILCELRALGALQSVQDQQTAEVN